jgi:fatty acid desaturase
MEELLSIRALTSDLKRPKPAIYWSDLSISSIIGYGSLYISFFSSITVFHFCLIVVAIFSLYRAMLFIHELAHLGPRAPRGFWLVWNILIGIPLFMPSFFYEMVHGLHHSKRTYGTRSDPEYLPFANHSKVVVAAFLLSSLLIPILLFLRSIIIVPLAAAVPRIRRLLIERGSSLVINPSFRRPIFSLEHNPTWPPLEIATSTWAWSLVVLTITGYITPLMAETFVLIAVGIGAVNQFRTLVAHRWESAGDPLTINEQVLDTVSVPPPALLPALWAPLGLRYHALHHLIPELPYHALGNAHRRIIELNSSSTYNRTIAGGSCAVFRRIFTNKSTAATIASNPRTPQRPLGRDLVDEQPQLH